MKTINRSSVWSHLDFLTRAVFMRVFSNEIGYYRPLLFYLERETRTKNNDFADTTMVATVWRAYNAESDQIDPILGIS